MLSNMQYLGLPTVVISAIVGVFLIIQIIGEIIEFKGKTVPEIIKVRKYFKRKRDERRAISKLPDLINSYTSIVTTLNNVNRLMIDINEHYSNDNITKRNKWMESVNNHIATSEERIKKQDDIMCELSNKLDKNNDITLSILIENKRGSIIDFANKVIDENFPVTKEQFNKIFKTHKEYEDIIEENQMTNGEVDIAHRIIEESYENHMKNHSFIENIRGYDI